MGERTGGKTGCSAREFVGVGVGVKVGHAAPLGALDLLVHSLHVVSGVDGLEFLICGFAGEHSLAPVHDALGLQPFPGGPQSLGLLRVPIRRIGLPRIEVNRGLR
jgi:hypothetical protein